MNRQSHEPVVGMLYKIIDHHSFQGKTCKVLRSNAGIGANQLHNVATVMIEGHNTSKTLYWWRLAPLVSSIVYETLTELGVYERWPHLKEGT